MAPKTARSQTPPPKAGVKAAASGSKTKRSASAGPKERPGSEKKSGKKTSSGDKAKKAKGDKTTADDASKAESAEAAEAVVEEDVGKRKRPKPETLKVWTTGATGAVDFIEEEEGEAATSPEKPPAEKPPVVEKPPAEKPAADAQAAADSGEDGAAAAAAAAEPGPTSWLAIQWLAEVENLFGCIASALLVDPDDKERQLEGGAALAHVRALESKEELKERLLEGGTIDRLCDAIWPKLEVLKAGPATASELATQWATEGAGDLLYGGLSSFFSGLEPRIGSPDPKVFKDMMGDHCSRSDAQVEFTTGNYSVVTTSEVEWKFVVEPETPIKWPLEERLMTDEATKRNMRKLMRPETLKKRMNEQVRIRGSRPYVMCLDCCAC